MGGTAVEIAIERIAAETTVSRLLGVACTELVELLEVGRCTISRTIGDLIVELGIATDSGAAPTTGLFQLSDFPLTRRVLEERVPHALRIGSEDVDVAEARLLTELGYDSLLMLPIEARGHTWGLVELYANGRVFDDRDVELASAVLDRVGALLPGLESGNAPA